tara:strand:+ start:13247 stop:13453 length:207 start_codon:yes stop_codon:yes gene_type:complete
VHHYVLTLGHVTGNVSARYAFNIGLPSVPFTEIGGEELKHHEQLTYRHAGRDFRLTDVHGNVLHDILV